MDNMELQWGFSRLSQIKKSVHDFQNSLENILSIALTRQELIGLLESPDVPDEAKRLASHPLIKAASDIKEYSESEPRFQKITKSSVIDLTNDDTHFQSHQVKPDIHDSDPVQPQLAKTSEDFPPKLPEINNTKLLRAVFTHKSVSRTDEDDSLYQNYERLEFIGDSVLNYVVTDIILKDYPSDDASDLTRLRAAIVSNRNLLDWSKLYGFDKKLIHNMDLTTFDTGTQKVYADVFEAYVGGVWLSSDGRLEIIKDWLRKLYEGEAEARSTKRQQIHLNSPSEKVEAHPIKVQHIYPHSTPLNPYGEPKRFFTSAQDEIASKQHLQEVKLSKERLYTKLNPGFLPKYITFSSTTPPEQPWYKVACTINDTLVGIGEAQNIKTASQFAAHYALNKNSLIVSKYEKFNLEKKVEGMIDKPSATIDQQISQLLVDHDMAY